MLELTPGTMLGGYRLQTRLQIGDDGRQVFLAQDERIVGREVVVKVAPLTDELNARRLAREFEILRQLDGLKVAEALGYSVSLAEGVSYLVLAAQGPSLAAVLAAAPRQKLEPEIALAVAHAIATLLGQMHSRGWGHGDLKPGNILCDGLGGTLLSDLEFAFRIGDATNWQEIPFIGTPPFMAPELWRVGMTARSAASDVWALGVTLYLLLCGEYPFGHSDIGAIQEALDRSLPARLAEFSRPLRDLFAALWVRDPSNRVPDGGSAAVEIMRVAEELGYNLIRGRHEFLQLVMTVPPAGGDRPAAGSTIFRNKTDGGQPAAEAVSPATQPKSPSTKCGPSPRPAAPTSSVPPGAPSSPPPAPPGAPPGAPPRHPAEYFDMASTCAPAPPRPAAAAPAPGTVPMPPPPSMPAPAQAGPGRAMEAAAAPAVVKRRAAARWYRRMNPDRNFPLTIVVSGKQIRIMGGNALGITLGERELVLDANEPILNVEPWFPGCLISPPRADMVCSQETATCRFWITPLVCGELPEACVIIRHQGKIVESLPTPSRVVKQTTAKLLAAVGLVSPVIGKAMQTAGWNPDELLGDWLPYAVDFISEIGYVGIGFISTGVLLMAAAAYYLVTRPLFSDAEPPLLAPETARTPQAAQRP